jgi:hypothetical protein
MTAHLRPTQGLATAVVILLSAQTVVLGLRALALLNRIRIVGMIARHEWVSQGSSNRADAWVRGAGVLWVLLFVVTIVVWCVWQHRSHLAARDLAAGMEISAAWAVGCWFVPIVNSFKPFQAMRELWRASLGAPPWRTQPTWSVLGWWWATWLGFNVLGWLQSTTGGGDLEAIRRSDAIGLLSVTLGIVAALLAVQIVRQISSRLTVARVVAVALLAPSWAVGELPLPPGPPLPPPPGSHSAG